MPKKLSHYDRAGRARMVDVSGKSPTRREAEASAFVALSPEVLAALPNNPKAIRWRWPASPESWPPNAPPI
jgi:molybdenum cofactor biosynthesis enzyme